MSKDVTVTRACGDEQIFTVSDEVADIILSHAADQVIHFGTENEETVILYPQNIISIVIEEEEKYEDEEYDDESEYGDELDDDDDEDLD